MLTTYLKYVSLILFIFISECTYADSLTVSPIGLTFHGKENSELAPYAPRKLDKNAAWTWHPELNVTYKQKYFQYTAFFMKDTINEPAGGLLFGPKYDLSRYFSLGIAGGPYFRPARYTPVPDFRIGGVQCMLMGGLTFSVAVPITSKLSIETNLLINGFINHGVGGLRLEF